MFARAADAAALRALSWPPELRLAKTLARASANSFLQGKPRTWQSQLSIHYATPEAQARGRRRWCSCRACGAMKQRGACLPACRACGARMRPRPPACAPPAHLPAC